MSTPAAKSSKAKAAFKAIVAWAVSRQGRTELGVVALAVYNALHRAGVL